MFEFFEHQHAGAARNHEAVAVDVIGTRCRRRRIVVFGRHRAHRIEQIGQRPVQIFAAAGEDHVLLAPLDDFRGIADAMIGGRAGRRDRIIHALDLEPGRKRRRRGGRHGLRHRERSDALGRAFLAGDVGGVHDRRGGRSARSHDDAGALVDDVALLDAAVADRLLHRDVIPGGTLPEKAHGPTIDHAFDVDVGHAGDLTAKAMIGELLRARNPRLRFVQARQNFLRVVSDGRDDAHPCHDHSPHHCLVNKMSVRRCQITRPPSEGRHG